MEGVILINIRSVAAIIIVMICITGCTKSEPKDSINSITSIELECNTPISEVKCENQSFNDEESIKIFEEAINTASEMLGELNYSAEYNMTISYANDITENYHLSLGSRRTVKGLLVNQENTSQGYEISVDHANKLRDLVSKH